MKQEKLLDVVKKFKNNFVLIYPNNDPGSKSIINVSKN